MSKSLLLIVGISVLLLGVIAQDETTTTKPTPTTTTKPTTTTTPTTTTKPTTTPTTTTPSPKYPGNGGKWYLEDSLNVTCIMMTGAIEISVKYVDTDKKNQTANVDVPKEANVTGNCILGTFKLQWNDSFSGQENSIEFTFEKNETGTAVLELSASGITPGKFGLQSIEGHLYNNPAVFLNNSNNVTDVKFIASSKAMFQTPLNHSYSCMQQEIIKSDDDHVTIKLSDIQLEAFRTTGYRKFNSAIDCPADDASDIVPIAVGAALAGLVLIVLIAYLIGRRRSRSRGYQSV
jgi:lysosomal-associated membrane protein 1/2